MASDQQLLALAYAVARGSLTLPDALRQAWDAGGKAMDVTWQQFRAAEREGRSLSKKGAPARPSRKTVGEP